MHRIKILFIQLSLLILLIFIWEHFSKTNIINSFIFSSPSKVLNCIINLYKNNNLLHHIIVTLNETIISFSLSIFIGLFIAVLLYEFNIVFKILEPFFTILNSMPKIALGPLFIILFGAGNKSIIIMSLSITVIINILTIYNSFTKYTI